MRHLPTNVAFRVHTSRMDVEVLGTESNVAARVREEAVNCDAFMAGSDVKRQLLQSYPA